MGDSRKDRIAKLEQVLEKTLRHYENAAEHITDDLQQAFYDLEETGRLPWPWKGEPYDQAQAARRLATWWHGAGFEEEVAEAKSILGGSSERKS